MARRTLDITGGGGRAIANELTTWEDVPRHGVVMLPGRGYTCDMPAFYYLEEMALDLGAAVLRLAPDYSRDERFSGWPLDQQQRDWLRDDVRAGVTAMLDAHDVPMLTVVAKSLTTLGLADVDWAGIAGGRTVRLVWLTPILRDATVLDRLMTADVPSLVVIGTDDFHYEPPKINGLIVRPAVSVEVIDGAGHSFSQRGDIDRSLANIGQVVRSVRGFAFS
jgi:hypothetical protein